MNDFHPDTDWHPDRSKKRAAVFLACIVAGAWVAFRICS